MFQELFANGIQLVIRVKSNLKNLLTGISDKTLLRKRAIIESINYELKNMAQTGHSRYRSFNNFIVNAITAFSQRNLPYH